MSETVNLKKSYGSLNEKLAKLFDESGVRRSFTVPYVEGQAMSDHISSVGQAATQSGGLGKNLLTTAHHSGGKGWGSGDGQTVAHPVDKLRTTIIPKDDENAKAVIDAAQSHINKLAKLLGDDDPAIVTANHQLALVKKTDGAGMHLFDFGVMMIQIMAQPTQAVARAHSGTKKGGHSPQLRGPEQQPAESAPEGAETAQGAAPAAGAAPTDQSAAPVAPAPPAASAAPVSSAPPTQG